MKKVWINSTEGKLTVVAIVVIVAIAIYWFAIRERKPVMIVSRKDDDTPKQADTPTTSDYSGSPQHKDDTLTQTSREGTADTTGTLPTPGHHRNPDDFPLRIGSEGIRVMQLQHYLQATYKVAFPDGITGRYDQHTADMVKKHMHLDQISKKAFTKRGIIGYYKPKTP